MKTIILITTVLISQLSLAGTGGGGVMATTASKTLQDGGSVGTLKQRAKLVPEIVFNKGVQNGVAKFAYGQLVDNKWNIQNIEMPEIDLMNDLPTLLALKNSKELNTWIEIK